MTDGRNGASRRGKEVGKGDREQRVKLRELPGGGIERRDGGENEGEEERRGGV